MASVGVGFGNLDCAREVAGARDVGRLHRELVEGRESGRLRKIGADREVRVGRNVELDRIAERHGAGRDQDGRLAAERDAAVRRRVDSGAGAAQRDLRGADAQRLRAEEIRETHAHAAAADARVGDVADRLVVECAVAGAAEDRIDGGEPGAIGAELQVATQRLSPKAVVV